MEALAGWVTDLPAPAIYAIIAVATFVENVFPPTPSDVMVTLAGFLTQHSALSPVGVWLAAWLANLAGAAGVYLAARRYGRRLLAGRLGRVLLPPETMVVMEREYLRFGAAGIFISRFLPGFRSVVAAFTGLVNLSPWTALGMMGLASALWYAAITWLGASLGAEWSAIEALLRRLNRTLGIVTIIAGSALLVWLVVRRRRRPARPDRLLRAVHRALGQETADQPEVPRTDPAAAGAALLLFELARADRGIPPEEHARIEAWLRERWGLDEPGAGGPPSRTAGDTREMAAVVVDRYDRDQRIELLGRLYQIACSDGTLSRHEETLLDRAARLLGVTEEELASVRRGFSAAGP
jgi:membrane protein DedA with SNARE-associated domain/uncharacterized tellurite resistance protein B-like protein